MCKKISAIKGMKDLYGINFKRHDKIKTTFQDVFRKFGYQEIIPNIIEEEQLFTNSLGVSSDIISKEMFYLESRGDKKSVLRPEGTACIMRYILENNMQYNMPQKLFYCGPMFRYERPQKGRLRQFHQIGIENIGSNDYINDVECILMAYESLQQLTNDFYLEINNLGCKESRQIYQIRLEEFLLRPNVYEHLSSESQLKIKTNSLRILDTKNPTEIKVLKDAPNIVDFISPQDKHNYENIRQMLTNLKVKYQENPFLVRGLDYYSQICFEAKVNTSQGQDALLGGGRYDGLSEILSQKSVQLPAVGFAAGIERIQSLIGDQKVDQLNQKYASNKIALINLQNSSQYGMILFILFYLSIVLQKYYFC